MTPFVKDCMDFIADICMVWQEIICYFFDHKWGKGEAMEYTKFYNRSCKRCGEFETYYPDPQRKD